MWPWSIAERIEVAERFRQDAERCLRTGEGERARERFFLARRQYEAAARQLHARGDAAFETELLEHAFEMHRRSQIGVA
jgi:hypothetical protein